MTSRLKPIFSPPLNYLAYRPKEGYALLPIWGDSIGRRSMCRFHIVDQYDGYVLERMPSMSRTHAEEAFPELRKKVQRMNRRGM